MKRLKARGAYVVDMKWEDGKLQTAKITSQKGGQPKIIINDRSIQLQLEAGEEFEIDVNKL